jgi:hypothetical protein
MFWEESGLFSMVGVELWDLLGLAVCFPSGRPLPWPVRPHVWPPVAGSAGCVDCACLLCGAGLAALPEFSLPCLLFLCSGC